MGCCNVAAGDTLTQGLTEGFVLYTGEDPGRSEVYVYTGLYLSDDPAPENHEYSYASRLKLLASVNAKQMDVVLMNREAYDLLSGEGWLLELPDWLAGEAPELDRALSGRYTENEVILSDNALEYTLNEAEAYIAAAEQAVNGVTADGLPLFAEAGFSGEVYLGVLANSPRLPAAAAYLDYLSSGGRN